MPHRLSLHSQGLRGARLISGLSLAWCMSALFWGCGVDQGPQTGSQTNWYRLCDDNADCGDLSCICGTCTSSCQSTRDCANLSSAACIETDQHAAMQLCGKTQPQSPVCLATCADQDCPLGSTCSDGVCLPTGEPTVDVVVDLDEQLQIIDGFGASLAFSSDVIVTHPRKQELFDAMFADSGMQVLRLRNRYEPDLESELAIPAEIVEAANDRLDEAPLLLMTWGSPPANFKANDSRACSDSDETCTLIQESDGSYDYAALADFWRTSLEQYTAQGILIDYLSIQNNPNWIPESSRAFDACRLLPTEGTATINVDGNDVEVPYPGYEETLEAVADALRTLPTPPGLIGPETNALTSISEYMPSLDSGRFSAMAIHLYDDGVPQKADFEDVRALAEERSLPVFQTEMQSDGLDTAVLIHQALTYAGASLYLQNDWITVDDGVLNEAALILLTEDDFRLQGPYHALAHYAKNTAPGWYMVDANTGTDDLLATAFASPAGDATTVVLVNPTSESLIATLPPELRERFADSAVTRTVFDGSESSAALGELSANGSVQVPAEAIVTVALSE